MDYKELMGTNALEDDKPMLPDGWHPGDDIFDPSSWGGTGNDAQDGGEAEETHEEPETHTEGGTEQSAAQSNEEAPEAGPESQPDEQQEESPKTYKITGVKVNHGDPQDVELTADEIRVAYQKACAFDRKKEKEAYRAAYNSQIEQGMSPEVSRSIAKDAANGNVYALTDEEEEAEAAAAAEAEQTSSQQTTTEDHEGKDLAKEIEMFWKLHPEEAGKPIPDSVSLDVARGAEFMPTMLNYLNTKSQKAVADLKKKNEILQQNAEAAASAPVRGVLGGEKTDQKEDPFLKGFMKGR